MNDIILKIVRDYSELLTEDMECRLRDIRDIRDIPSRIIMKDVNILRDGNKSELLVFSDGVTEVHDSLDQQTLTDRYEIKYKGDPEFIAVVKIIPDSIMSFGKKSIRKVVSITVFGNRFEFDNFISDHVIKT